MVLIGTQKPASCSAYFSFSPFHLCTLKEHRKVNWYRERAVIFSTDGLLQGVPRDHELQFSAVADSPQWRHSEVHCMHIQPAQPLSSWFQLSDTCTLWTHLIVGTIKCGFCHRKRIALLNTHFVIDISVYVVYRSESSSQLLVPAKCEGYQIR